MSATTTDEAPSKRPARTIRFSSERSLGMVMVSADGTPSPPPQPALGTVEVPEGAAVVLVIDAEATGDATLLESLGADDIDMVMKLPADDAWLAAASRLTGISSIVTRGEVSDVGLEHLAKLVNLSSVVLQAGSVTAEGVRHLATLPKLARLMLAGPVTLDVLKPLAAAPRLGGLQVPGADEETLDGLRDLFPDMPIGGVWLSPKARRRLQAKKDSAATA